MHYFLEIGPGISPFPAVGKRGDGCSLPFKDLSICEVVCCNVFGAPRIREQIPGITVEIGRVLKVDGILTIVETYTPAPFNQMRLYLESNGFHLKTNGQSVYDLEQIAQYARRPFKSEPPKSIDARPYFAQFRKLTQPLF